MKRFLLVSVVLVGIVSGLLAFPFANYGHIRVPDAYVMPHTMTKLTMINYFLPEDNKMDDDLSYNWGAALNVGVLDYGEVGLVFSGDDIFYMHLKASIIRETMTLPDITVGIDNLFSDVKSKEYRDGDYDIVDAGNYRRNSLYLAISKSTVLGGIPGMGQIPTRLTIGAGSNRFIGTVDFSKQFGGVFGAAQLELMNNLNFIGEIDGHNLNTALELVHGNISGKLMFYKMEEWNRRDPKFGLSVSYIFDHFVDDSFRRVTPDRIDQSQMRGREVIDRRDSDSLDELQRIRRERERAEQELEAIRRLLEE